MVIATLAEYDGWGLDLVVLTTLAEYDGWGLDLVVLTTLPEYMVRCRIYWFCLPLSVHLN